MCATCRKHGKNDLNHLIYIPNEYPRSFTHSLSAYGLRLTSLPHIRRDQALLPPRGGGGRAVDVEISAETGGDRSVHHI